MRFWLRLETRQSHRNNQRNRRYSLLVVNGLGTFHFMAPECLKDKKSGKGGYSGQQADIWSLGVVLYCIVERKLPFYDENLLQLFQKIESEK